MLIIIVVIRRIFELGSQRHGSRSPNHRPWGTFGCEDRRWGGPLAPPPPPQRRSGRAWSIEWKRWRSTPPTPPREQRRFGGRLWSDSFAQSPTHCLSTSTRQVGNSSPPSAPHRRYRNKTQLSKTKLNKFLKYSGIIWNFLFLKFLIQNSFFDNKIW